MEDDIEKENVEVTTAAAGSIKQISGGIIHQICSGQVVLSLATAVKELLENSLDAGATNIEIKLRVQGAELVEVSDNGHGVEEENFAGLTVKHATSKLSEFSDLAAVETFGFRGEALSSLCALSKLSVSTRHKDAELGTVLNYDHDGVMVSRSCTARPVGTTVTIANIFSTMPVRQKEFQRNIKKEYSKMMSVVTAYGLVSRGVKIKVTNLKPNNKQDTALQTQGSQNIRENLVNIYGVKIMSSLKPVTQATLSEEYLIEINHRGPVPNVKLEGFISSPVHGEGRGAPDRQFLFINSRPCDHVKITKIINQVYHSYNRLQFPFVCLNIVTERDTVDVNITPDKRQIFLTQERFLVALVKKTLERMYEDAPCTMPLQSFIPKTDKKPEFSQVKSSFKSSFNISNLKRNFSSSFSQKSPDYGGKKLKTMHDFVKVTKAGEEKEFISQNIEEITEETEIKVEKIRIDDDKKKVNKHCYLLPFDASPEDTETDTNIHSDSVKTINLSEDTDILTDMKIKVSNSSCSKSSKSDSNCEERSDRESKPSIVFDDFQLHPSESIGRSVEKVDDFKDEKGKISPCVGAAQEVKDYQLDSNQPGIVIAESKNNDENVKERRNVEVTFDFSELRKSLQSTEKTHLKEGTENFFKAQISPSENESAESELRKQLKKSDFRNMYICGQFNLGFIIARLNKDLFIIDQHATDEKYNFETLQKTTVIKSQKMVVPMTLELTSVNESLLTENMFVFVKNGFHFSIDESAPSTQRVKLVSLPMSKNWTFGKEDIDELLFMLSEMGGDEMTDALRPTRVRAMFASRACRKSVMIGHSLSRGDMARLVRHMGMIEQPWNCPHGRPTLRHLINTDVVRLSDQ